MISEVGVVIVRDRGVLRGVWLLWRKGGVLLWKVVVEVWGEVDSLRGVALFLKLGYSGMWILVLVSVLVWVEGGSLKGAVPFLMMAYLGLWMMALVWQEADSSIGALLSLGRFSASDCGESGVEDPLEKM